MSAWVGLHVGLHAQIARLAEVPQFASTEAESKSFLQAVQNVARHYSIATTQKAMDWAAFAVVAGLFYGPRMVALSKRRTAPPRPPQSGRNGQAGPAELFRFRTEAPGPAPVDYGPAEPDPIAG